MLILEVEEHQNIVKLLEEENIALQEEIKQLKSASSFGALVAVNDEGFSFLETENAALREELETLKQVRPTSSSRGRARTGRRNLEDTRTQQTLAHQAAQMKAKNQALVKG